MGSRFSPCCRLAAAPSHGPKGPPGFPRTRHRLSTRPLELQLGLPAAPASSKTLGAVRRVTGRLEFPLAGACHVHRAAPAIGWRVGRAQGRGGDAASSAAGAVEWPVRAPEGDVVWRARRGVPLAQRRGGEAGPAGRPAPRNPPELHPGAPPGLRRARPTRRLQGSEAEERSAPRGSESAAS